MGLDKWMTCTHHGYHTFSLPKKPSVLHLFTPPSLLTAGSHQSSYCLHNFVFSRTLYWWNHIVYSLLRWASSLSNMHLSVLHVFLWLDSSFLFNTEQYFIDWMDYSWFNHSPTEGYLGFFQVLIIINKVAINIYPYLCFCRHKFSTCLDKCQKLWLLDWEEYV